jgi:hypothetical protein
VNQIAVLVLRALAGGALVVVFALVSEIVKPKVFAGLFAAAPSVAIASLAITVLADGASRARQASIGMAAGAVGMAACCALAAAVIPRLKALWGSLVAAGGWAVVALGLYWVVFIGGR